MFATASPVLTSCQICPITRCICVFADAEIFNASKGLHLLLTGINCTLIKLMPSVYCCHMPLKAFMVSKLSTQVEFSVKSILFFSNNRI